MSRRDQIKMSDAEVAAFLDEQRVVTCATFGPRGWPHLMPLWYVVRDGRLWAWTFAKSQKTRNLERDAALRRCRSRRASAIPRAARRDVGVRSDGLHRDIDDVAGVGMELFERYYRRRLNDDSSRDGSASRPRSASALEFVEQRRATWDHSKLGGVY